MIEYIATFTIMSVAASSAASINAGSTALTVLEAMSP
jgi:hypothetical protein